MKSEEWDRRRTGGHGGLGGRKKEIPLGEPAGAVESSFRPSIPNFETAFPKSAKACTTRSIGPIKIIPRAKENVTLNPSSFILYSYNDGYYQYQ